MPIEVPDCHCVLCQELTELDWRTRTTADTVIEHGWQVLMVPADDAGPGWAYTIGLWHKHGLPELAMFGLDARVMHQLLNDLAKAAVNGEPAAADQERHGIVKGYPVVLKSVDYRWYEAFFGTAIGFYRRPPFDFLQVVWPSRDGAFPWQPGGDDLLNRQPRLWLHPDEHPVGVWTQDL
ncbi:DUF4262 domain-containing protein [Catenulispora subtropica]|uniref:DUF4262 domain-containing protein n=1 Tax=Catenulispora subtropica TaxID=450798 RepID=A0ABP5E5D6_9ACTN